MGYSRKKIDMTGQRYGRLTVLEPAENIDGRTAWRCICDCGQEITAKTCHLRDGHVTSCGCAKLDCLTYVDGTCVELLRAKTVRRNNTSGVPGVDWRPSKGLWRAAICFKGKRYYLGSYSRFEDAVQARKRAEEELHDKFVSEFAGEEPPRHSAADSYMKEEGRNPMQKEHPPAAFPAAEDAGGGGNHPGKAIGKPRETVGLQSYGN